MIDSGRREEITEELFTEIDAVIHAEEVVSRMPLKSLVEDVFDEVPGHLRRQYNRFIEVTERRGEAQPGDGAFPL